VLVAVYLLLSYRLQRGGVCLSVGRSVSAVSPPPPKKTKQQEPAGIEQWEQADATSFKVRSMDYLRTKVKAPSEAAVYRWAACLSFCPSVRPLACLFICPSVCLPVCLSSFLSGWLSGCLSVGLSVADR
jgi:hypothetical protein